MRYRSSSRRATGGPSRGRSLLCFVHFVTISITTAFVWQACRPESPEEDQGSLLGPGPDETVSITLAWDAPTLDAAGQPLQDLAGFRLYFGPGSPLDAARDTFVDVGLATQYTLAGLAPGTYYFATSALDHAGNESALSAEIGAELSPP